MYSFASYHPMDISRFHFALVASEVLTVGDTLLHVSDSFEFSMRTIRETSWKLGMEVVKGSSLGSSLIPDVTDNKGGYLVGLPIILSTLAPVHSATNSGEKTFWIVLSGEIISEILTIVVKTNKLTQFDN